MSANTPPIRPEDNRQAGRALDADDPAAADVVATGDRREEIHFEADPDQLVVARHLVRPAGPLPPQDDDAVLPESGGPPVEDVRVAPESPSVWDARPPADDAETSGNPTGD